MPSYAFAQVGMDTMSTAKHSETVISSSPVLNNKAVSNDDEEEARVVSFRPEDVQLQSRYRPTEKDTLFPSQLWRRLYAGIGAGFQGLSDNVSSVQNTHFAAYLGYRFTPIHSLRVHGTYTTFKYGANNSRASRSLGIGIDYLANITNFAWGCSDSRMVDVSTILGAGTRVNGAGLVSRITPYVHLGAHVDLQLSSYISLFAEPYVGVHKNMDVLFGRPNRERWNLMYGANAGLQMALEKRKEQYVKADTIYRRFFFDSSIGIAATGRSGGIMHRAGVGYQGALGVWLNPMLGIRVGVQAQSVRWSSGMTKMYGASVRSSNTQLLASGRAEVVLNPLNFSRRWRNSTDGHDFDLNVLLGGDFGWDARANTPNATNGVYYYGLTGALQFLYRIYKPTYIFVEPRYVLAKYDAPYQNGNNGQTSVGHNLSFNVGTRIYMWNNTSQLSDSVRTFTPRWWAGVDVGGVKWQRTQALTTGGLGYNPSVGISLGYDLARYASLRAQLVYQRLYDTHTSSYLGYDSNGRRHRGSGLWNSAYDVMDFRLSYMLNLNNVFQGYNNERLFNLWWTAGPSLSYVFNQSDTWVEDQKGKLPLMSAFKVNESREGKFSPGVSTSLMATLRPTRKSRYELLVEAMGQYNFISGVNPGNRGRLNSVKYGLTVGTRYQLETDTLYNFFSGADSRPWQKGWELNASYGWALPLGTGLGLRGTGTNLTVSAGYWFNAFLGARLGFVGQQTYHDKRDVAAVVNPASGTLIRAPYSVYYSQLMLGGRAELMLNPLNFIRSHGELDEAPRWDLNLSAGMNFGGMGKYGGHAGVYTGFTTSAALLYRLSDVTQLYLEPRYDMYNYRVYNALLDRNETSTDRMLTFSVGARLTRPVDKQYEGRTDSTTAARRGLWVGATVGGAKMMQSSRVSGSAISVQPSIGVSVGYDISRLSSVRANFVYDIQSRLRPNQPYKVNVAGTDRRYTGTIKSRFHQLDMQLLYMLNVTNLWTGQDKRNKLNVYLEAGPVLSTIMAQNNSLVEGEQVRGTDFRYWGRLYDGKYSFALATGVLMALPVSDSWDITAELLGQYYLNRSYMPEHSPHFTNGIKMNLSAGTRYYFDQDKVSDFFGGADAKPWQKGWEFNASYGWAVPLDTKLGLRSTGTRLSVSAGYWFNAFLGARLGLTSQQTYYRKQNVSAVYEPVSGIQVHAPYSVYCAQYILGGRVELMTNPLNFFASRRELDEAPRWDVNLSLGLNFGGFGKARAGLAGGYVGLTTSAPLLYRLSNITQLYLEPRYDVYSYSKYNADMNYNESFADRVFTLSIGARITRPVEESRESKRPQKPEQMAHRGLWLSASVGGVKMLQLSRVATKGISIQPSVAASVGYDFSRLSGLRVNFIYDMQSRIRPNQPYTVTSYDVSRQYTGTVKSTIHQMDMQLLYMLNLTNLWTGYDKRNKFNIYFEGGTVLATNLAQRNSLIDGELMGGTDFRYMGRKYGGECSFALASGLLMAMPLTPHWDVTAELMGHFYFNRGYMPEHSPQFLNAIKMNFSVGTRYNF